MNQPIPGLPTTEQHRETLSEALRLNAETITSREHSLRNARSPESAVFHAEDLSKVLQIQAVLVEALNDLVFVP